MSPSAFVAQAQAKGLDIIGLTEQYSTLNSEMMRRLGGRMGLLVLMEEEATSKEEVYCMGLIFNGFLLTNYYLMNLFVQKNHL